MAAVIVLRMVPKAWIPVIALLLAGCEIPSTGKASGGPPSEKTDIEIRPLKLPREPQRDGSIEVKLTSGFRERVYNIINVSKSCRVVLKTTWTNRGTEPADLKALRREVRTTSGKTLPLVLSESHGDVSSAWDGKLPPGGSMNIHYHVKLEIVNEKCVDAVEALLGNLRFPLQ